MPIRTDCSSCGKKLKVRDELIGKKIKCPGCGMVFLAQAAAEATALTAEEARSDLKKPAQDARKPVAKSAPPPDADEDSEDRPARRRKKKKPAPAVSGMWIGIGVATAVVLVVAVGCFILFSRSPSKNDQLAKKGPAKVDPVAATELGPRQLIQPGIQFQEATLRRGAIPMRVWYYEPEKTAGKLALVLVPPAGSTLFAGMDLGDGDRAEHYPYVQAGFAVASFEIDGNVSKNDESDAQVLKGALQFRNAQAGVSNAKAALDFILAKAPNVDPNRVYIAGHSSAATLALLVASHEPRIKACAAYAPVTDVEARLAPVIPQLDKAMPGYRDFLVTSSPKNQADKLKCPVFLFHAEDDNNVPVSQTTDFAAQLKKSNSQVTLVTTKQGGHYDSMIQEGIPKGIAWLRGMRP
jgi:dienelactone hydrolase